LHINKAPKCEAKRKTNPNSWKEENIFVNMPNEMQTKAQRTRLGLLTFRLLWLFLNFKLGNVGVLPFFPAFDQAQACKKVAK